MSPTPVIVCQLQRYLSAWIVSDLREWWESEIIRLVAQNIVSGSEDSAGISVRYGASRAPKPVCVVFLVLPSAPAPWEAPIPFKTPDTPQSMNSPHAGPSLFVYSSVEPCGFDRWLSNCVSIYQKPHTSNYKWGFIWMEWFIPYEPE